VELLNDSGEYSDVILGVRDELIWWKKKMLYPERDRARSAYADMPVSGTVGTVTTATQELSPTTPKNDKTRSTLFTNLTPFQSRIMKTVKK